MAIPALPREILKWLQSLDLTYQIRNPRRDFANGFTIAEIFSRYYPHDPLLVPGQMYTGESMELKAKNWEQLQKFFRRRSIKIPAEATRAVMASQPDAGPRFIVSVYTLLTGKRIKSFEGPPVDGDVELVPHFTLPTTGSILRTVNGGPEKAKMIIEAHREYIRQLRALEPQPVRAHPSAPLLPSAADESAAHAARHAHRHHTEPPPHLAAGDATGPGAAVVADKNELRIGSAGIATASPVVRIRVNQNLA
ncbi:spermatogenesis-associated protein 4 [Geranomyces variabilis]|nr:spermatogenesis-associated protein 4 [Geranomyces variabilis]